MNAPEGWRVEITRPATRDLRRLDRPMRERILASIDHLASDPPPGDIKRMSGITPPQWRLRVGDWRVRFNRDPETRTILLVSWSAAGSVVASVTQLSIASSVQDLAPLPPACRWTTDSLRLGSRRDLAMRGRVGAVRALLHDEPLPKRRISVLILDEHNLAEIARHGVSAAEVVQLIGNRYITAPNRRGEPGGILLIGETDGGRLLTIPLAPTDDPTTWRPATAFEASRHQRTVFRRRAR